MKWTLALLAAVATANCSATPPPACAAFAEATKMNAAYHFPPENAGRPGGYGAVSRSPTLMILVDPKQLAGKTARVVSAVKEPCCSVELVTQDCQRAYIHSPTGVFTAKSAAENGYEMAPITGRKPPSP